MHILRPHLNSGVSQVACPLFFYTPLVVICTVSNKIGLVHPQNRAILFVCFRIDHHLIAMGR